MVIRVRITVGDYGLGLEFGLAIVVGFRAG